jgi:DNA repair exonuclease SbcCD ATPase subunit
MSYEFIHKLRQPDVIISFILIFLIIFIYPKLSFNIFNNITISIIYLLLIFYVIVYKEYIGVGIFMLLVFLLSMNLKKIEGFNNQLKEDKENNKKKEEEWKKDEKKIEKEIENLQNQFNEENEMNKYLNKIQKTTSTNNIAKIQDTIRLTDKLGMETEDEKTIKEKRQKAISELQDIKKQNEYVNNVTNEVCTIVKDRQLPIQNFATKYKNYIKKYTSSGTNFNVIDNLNDKGTVEQVCKWKISPIKE